MNDEKTHIPESFSASPAPARRRTGLSEGELERRQPGGFQSLTPRALLPPPGAGAAGWGEAELKAGVAR